MTQKNHQSSPIIFVSDFFTSDLQGGAELTTEAIIEKSPYPVYQIHSRNVTETMVKGNKDKYWILGNYATVPKAALIELVQSQVKYSIIEYDFKFCKYRSTHLHELQTGNPCDCHLLAHPGKFTVGLMKRAQSVHFMSCEQLYFYHRLFPQMSSWTNLTVQSSTWTDAHLDFLEENGGQRNRNGKWAVLGGGSWIKNQVATEEYAKQTYGADKVEVIGNLPYLEFLKKLSEFEGLVFHPSGFDTCPRIVIEAKLLGCKLDLNDNVLHKNEAWFSSEDREVTMEFVRGRGKHFWDVLFPCD